MRLAFGDIKKTISHRGGEPRLIPYLLHPRSASIADARKSPNGGSGGRLARELDALVALYESYVGRPRSTWPEDRAAAIIGDYRLARCLENVLSEWYAWQSPTWPQTGETAAVLGARDIMTPSQLRLALYDFVSTSYGGFLPTSERDAALDTFAATLAISRTRLENLLNLDADARAVLARTAPDVPRAARLATRYNQRVLEAVLANAAQVEWLLTPAFAAASGEPLGALVKRVCFLARRMGIQYEVAFSDPETHASDQPLPLVAERRAPYSTGWESSPLVITLYGLQEMTGAPTQYGERLARLCRALLGYRRAPEKPGRSALAGSGLSGSARVYLHRRPLTFDLDARLLNLIASPGDDEAPRLGADPLDAVPQFDSSLEQGLHDQFSALERDGEAHGWRLEREPEPILAGSTILVPDFALTRGPRRVYLEIAGYWRPEYRERKVRKLASVRGHVALALAVPESARAEFAAIERDFPILWYKSSVSAAALLALLDRAYNDLDARLARLDLASIGAEVTSRGLIPSVESMALLCCYSRGELARALDLLQRHAHATNESSPAWLDGIGLCSSAWLAELLLDIRRAVMQAAGQRLPVAKLAVAVSAHLPGRSTVAIPEVSVEALARLAGLHVVRTSIFDAEVCAEDAPPASAPLDATPSRAPATQPRRRLRRKHTSTTTYMTQSIFPPERPGPDNPEPDFPTRAS